MSSHAEGARLHPRDAADVAAIVAGAVRPLEPLGGGSKRQIGKPIAADILDLSALDGIVTYEPAELVLTARAATPLATIERTLAAHAQRLAFEPPDLGRLFGGDWPQTIGGVLAANAAGSRRVAAGAARDHFLGFQAVAGSGESFKAGGKVVKNVTGYDLPKLLAGSWGTLAVLTEVTHSRGAGARARPHARGRGRIRRRVPRAARHGVAFVARRLCGRSRSRARQLAAARRLRGLRRSADARALRRVAVHTVRGARGRCVARVLARAGER